MRRKFEINPSKIKGGCQSGTKVVTHDSKSDLPLGPHKSFAVHILLTWKNLQIKVEKLLVAVTQPRLLFMVNITQFCLETDLKAVRCLYSFSYCCPFFLMAKRVALDVM